MHVAARRGEVRLEPAPLATLVGSRDDEMRVGKRGLHAIEGRREEIEPLDRVEAAEEEQERCAVGDAQPQARRPGERESRSGSIDAIWHGDHRRAGNPEPERARLGLRGGVQERGAHEIASLDDDVGDPLAPGALGDGARRQGHGLCFRAGDELLRLPHQAHLSGLQRCVRGLHRAHDSQ